jgi:hypothetical protein
MAFSPAPEWTGIRLALLPDKAAGSSRKRQSLLVEGADAAGMSRSVPIKVSRRARRDRRQSLEKVQMPNHDGFIPFSRQK